MSSYSYDSFGNITETERPNSAGVTVKNTYSYENSSWRDLLTAYNGHTITYDKIGNPLSYYNGRSYTLRWEMGRQLLSSRVNSRTVYYDYNKDGIRIEKNVSGRYTDRYILDGSKVIGMERTKSGSSVKDVYHFIYDEMGNIWEAVCYIGGSTTPVRYFYRTNAQGDVKQIVDSNYNVVAYYAYDAWGKLLAVLDGNDNPITDSSHFAIVNPFRYRGYIYDTETGFYYLQSRYYDPEIGRFINADGYVTTDIEPIAMNMFAYCGNNPVNNIDEAGMCYYNAKGKWTHDNWEFQIDEREEHYKIKDEPIDVTEKLTNEMLRNAKEIADVASDFVATAALVFADNVCPGHEWDLKTSWNLSKDELYLFNDEILRFDDIGNIHYGFVGRTIFPSSILLKMGGVVQIFTGTSSFSYAGSNFDDPRDQWAIQYGYNLWDLGK